jgi:adenosine deaminase
MPGHATDADIATIPKVELHLHLNGSISETTAATLARRHGADPDEVLGLVDGRYPGPHPSFEGFLAAYLRANEWVRTPEDLELVAAELARDRAAQGIAYSEAIVTAMILVRNGMEPQQLWAALRRGLAAAGPGIRINLIVDAIRDLGAEEAEATVRLVEEADAPIVGLCLTGIEGTMPVETFVPFRAAARRLGLGFTVHAGEMGPPESVAASLDVLQADRIGHGVASIRDPELVERLVRDQVVLEVCPSSNVWIGEYPSLEAHPFAELWRRGVQVTISSDDPPFFHTTLLDELGHVVRIAGLSREDLVTLQLRASEASFADAATKAAVRSRIEAWARAAATT